MKEEDEVSDESEIDLLKKHILQDQIQSYSALPKPIWQKYITS